MAPTPLADATRCWSHVRPTWRWAQTDPTRAAAWRALTAEGLSDEQVGEIRAHLQQQKVLGSDRFQDWVAQRTGLFAGVRPRGRPPAENKCP